MNKNIFSMPQYMPLAEFATLEQMVRLSSNSSQFSHAVRDRYAAAGFKVTVLQFNNSLLLDFFCGVLGVGHTCHFMRNITNIMSMKVNPSVLPSCSTDVYCIAVQNSWVC